MPKASREELEKFFEAKGVNTLLSKIVENICESRPENIHQFIVEFLFQDYKDRLDLRFLETFYTLQEIQSTFQRRNLPARVTEDVTMSHDSCDSPSSPFVRSSVVDEEIAIVRQRRNSVRGRRAGISAAPLNPLPEGYIPPKVPKSDFAKQRLRIALSENILFNHLDHDQLSVLFDAMQEQKFNPSDTIIRQGEQGDHFYVVDEGECEIFVKDISTLQERLVMTVTKGQSFGELALMYGMPRAATVKARTAVSLWCLDRQTYRFILMDTTLRKRQLYKSFLRNVSLLETLIDYEIELIADALEPVDFKDGDCIIEQGTVGHSFFIVEKGSVSVFRTENDESKHMIDLSESNFFGEVALLTNEPRQASVYAKGDCKCLKLNRRSFERLLGPCEEILRRNMEKYNLIMGTSHSH